MNPGYEYLHGIWKRYYHGLPHDLVSKRYSLLTLAALMHGNTVLPRLLKRKNFTLSYFYALQLLMLGHYAKARDLTLEFLKAYPHHEESFFLLSDCAAALNEKKEAQEALCAPALSGRKKIWDRLANLVENPSDYSSYLQIVKERTRSNPALASDYVVLMSQVKAAQRAGIYSDALEILERVGHNRIAVVKARKIPVHPRLAKDALSCLLRSARKAKLEIFLISGTLLGLIRDGRFIPHDTDLDTGIFAGFDKKLLLASIHQSGCFIVLPETTPHCIRIRHINGVSIDIFTHYRDEHDFWHGGIKMLWHNSPFRLRSVRFQGISTLIPDPPEQYLEENYGVDWKIPRTNFDSATDCPNATVANEQVMKIHMLKKELEQNT